MSLNTLNLKQKQGGRVIKQADRSSTFKFALQDSNGALVNLNGQTANISLHNPNNGRYWETTASVKNSEVEFKLPGNLASDDYILEITVGGYVFPSDNDFIIEVVKGYKNLTDKQTAESYKKSIEEITQEVQREADKKLKDTIALIGTKKDQALKEIDGQVKVATNKYLNDKVDKVVGKGLSDNNFTNLYKSKLDNLDTTIDDKIKNKAEKDEVKGQIQEVKDLIFDNAVKYANDTVYVLDTKVESGEVKVVPKEIGKLVANDFLKVKVDSDKYRFRIKSTSQGVILFYSMSDTSLRYAVHVYPNVKDYKINFGKVVNGEMIFTSVTMPEDKVSVIREEGL